MKNNFPNPGQSLIGIIIVLIVVGLFGGGLYYYLSKQIPEVPEITRKLAKEVVKPEEVVPPPEEELPEEEVIPEEKIKEIVQKCADGTLYGQCSINKPKYCDNGNLIDKCSICGCSSGYLCNKTSNQCIEVIEPKALEMLKFCEKIKDLSRKNSCLLTLSAIATNEILFCGEDFRCLESVSFKNPLACEKMEDLKLDEWDVSSCYLRVGQKTKNSSWCEKIPKSEFKNGCYYYIARETNNENLCGKLDLDYGKPDGGCWYLGWINICGKTPMDDCYTTIALSSSKESLCEKIKDGQGREFNCYLQIAKKKTDVSICNYIKNPDIKTYCLAAVTENESLCENLGNAALATGLPLKDSCYGEIGTKKKDLSICDKATGHYRTSCYYGVTEKTLNPSLCPTSGIFVDSCYRKLAELKADHSLCTKISDFPEKVMCYIEVAIVKKDALICNNLTDFERSWCIQETAKKSKDPLICEMIEKQDYKDICLNQAISTALDLYIEY